VEGREGRKEERKEGRKKQKARHDSTCLQSQLFRKQRQKDCGSGPTWAKLMRLYLKSKLKAKGLGTWLGSNGSALA
jgi:hypothetical protein